MLNCPAASPSSPFLPFTCTVTRQSITYCVFLLQETCRLSVHKYAIFFNVYTHQCIKRYLKFVQKKPPSPTHLADHRLIYAALRTLHLSLILLRHFVRTVLFFHRADDEARPLLVGDSSAPLRVLSGRTLGGGGTENETPLHKNVSQQKEDVTLLCFIGRAPEQK